jgi:hypothetical protein
MDDAARVMVLVEVARLRANGYSWRVCASSLNARGVDPPSGVGQWWPSSVQRFADPTVARQWAGYMRTWRGRLDA